jgi:chromosomal replication initiation ATPase DnaA
MKVTIEFEYSSSNISFVKYLLKIISFGVKIKIMKIIQTDKKNDRGRFKFTIPFIQNVTSEETKIPVSSMVNCTRKRDVLEARYIAMYWSRVFTDKYLRQIGEEFGKKDHATVINAIRKVNIYSVSKSSTEANFKSHFKRVGERLRAMI